MNYEILEKREEVTVKTLVKYEDIDEPILISHFMPKDDADIELGISNRYESEKRALEANEE
jgi:hypothetical protein